MTELQKDFLTPAIVRALRLGGFALEASSQLVPVLTALQLEQSGWPPFVPLEITIQVSPVAAQFSVFSLDWVNPPLSAAPASDRLVITEIDLENGGPEFVLSYCFTDGNTGVTGTQTVQTVPTQDLGNLDQLFIPATTGARDVRTPLQAKGGTQVGDPILGQPRLLPCQTNTWTRNSVYWILRPGHGLIIRSAAVNEFIGVRLVGRYYTS